MKISYRIEKEDYVAAQRLHRSKGQTRISRAFGIIFGIFYLFALLVGLAMFAIDRSLWPMLVRPLLLVGILWAAIYWVLAPFLWRRSYAKDRRFQEQFTAEFSDDGIDLRSATFEGTIKWAYFLRVLEADRLFLFYQSPRLFNIFPKRAFAPGEADQFRELLKRKLPSK